MKRNVLIESLGIAFMNVELIKIEAKYICFKISEDAYSRYEDMLILDKHTSIHFLSGTVLFHHHTERYKIFK